MSVDPAHLGAQVSHVNINSQILSVEGPQLPREDPLL